MRGMRLLDLAKKPHANAWRLGYIYAFQVSDQSFCHSASTSWSSSPVSRLAPWAVTVSGISFESLDVGVAP